MRTVSGAFLACVAIGCSSTRVVDEWTSAAASSSPIEDVLVVAVVRDEGLRRMLENELTAHLMKEGVSAVASHRVLDRGELTRDAVREVVDRDEFDHVLVTSYVGVETDIDYVPSASGGFYGHLGGLLASPGYYDKTTTLTMQTRLYDARQGGEMVWSGTSETTDPSASERGMDDVAKEIVEELGEDVAI